MELTLYTEAYFDAAHRIEGHEGKCAFFHGHTWKIAIWVKGNESQLNPQSILWDFGNAKKIAEFYDHKNLNELIDGNSTAEKLVLDIYRKLKDEAPQLLFKVRVYENVTSKQSYCEGGDFN